MEPVQPVPLARPALLLMAASRRGADGSLGAGRELFKNACVRQVEMSPLRAICCLPAPKQAISRSSFVAFPSRVEGGGGGGVGGDLLGRC